MAGKLSAAPKANPLHSDQPPRILLTTWKITLILTLTVILSLGIFQFPSQFSLHSCGFLAVKNPSYLEQARHILDKNPLIDGHNDLLIRVRLSYDNNLTGNGFRDRFYNGSLEGHTDLVKIKEGRYGGAFWSAFYPCPGDISDFSSAAYDPIIRATLQQLDLHGRIAEIFPKNYPTTRSGRHYTPNPHYARFDFQSGHLISPLAIEGLHQIGNSPSVLRLYNALGVRYATLTWNCHNNYADAAVLSFPSNRTSIRAPPLHHGLSIRGRQIVHEMNRMGMLVDLAHVSPATMSDVLVGSGSQTNGNDSWNGSIATPFFSHSSAYALCPHPRNVPDEVLQLVKERNSVVMVNFSPGFISCRAPPEDAPEGTLPEVVPEGATLEKVADHVMHIGKLIGYAHVGIGSDFDGIEWGPKGLEDVSRMPNLVAELLKRGVHKKDVIGIVGGNVLRVWEEADQTGRRLRAEGMEQLEDWETGWPGIGNPW